VALTLLRSGVFVAIEVQIGMLFGKAKLAYN